MLYKRSDVYLVNESSKLESVNKVYESGEKSHSLLDHPRTSITANFHNVRKFRKIIAKSNKMSHCMGKPTISIGANKGADQLRSKHEADQHLCFHYMNNTIHLLFQLLAILFGCTDRFVSNLVRTQIVGFLMHRLK